MKLQHLIVFLAAILFTTLSNATPETNDYGEVSSGTLFLNTDTTSIDAIVLNSKVNMRISGPVADVTLRQFFRNTSTEWVEGVYVFPLPENASVRSMNIQVGERSIKGAIHERIIATKKYVQAKSNGQLASVLNMQRNNLFTTKIANIAPGESISVELDYFQTLDNVREKFSLLMPTTYTPRYKPGDLQDMAIQTADDRENTLPQFELQIILDSEEPLSNIQSSSHDVDVIRLDDKYLVSLQNGSETMDRDFLLSWSEDYTRQPAVRAYLQEKNTERYALFMIHPPAPEFLDDQPRELIFVLDISGSMAGNSIRAAKKALTKSLEQLGPDDRFNIIAFNDQAQQLYQTPQQANPALVSQALYYLDSLHADGGTEIYPALELALTQQDARFLRQIVMITDGSVGNEDQILQMLNLKLDQARLFTVGIGTAPNSYFMRKAATLGRGNARFANQTANVDKTIAELFEQLKRPALTSIKIRTESGDSDLLPNPVPDLYAGQPLFITAKLSPEDRKMSIEGTFGGELFSKELVLEKVIQGSDAISSVWAREKIEQLMDQQLLYGESINRQQEIIKLSKKHGVLSKYTSFLAIDSKPIREQHTSLKSKVVSSALPAGSEMMAVSLPQGATNAGVWLALGLLILIVNTFFRLKTIAWRINS